MRIPLKVLVVDSASSSADLLVDSLRALSDEVISIEKVEKISDAMSVLKKREINAIFIDPLAIGLESSSGFIFNTREIYPSIVFVLYLEFNNMERVSSQLFSGERKRLKSYYKLDKGAPVAIFREEILAAVIKCQNYLKYSLTEESLRKLQEELGRIKADENQPTGGEIQISVSLLQEIKEQLKSLTIQKHENDFPINEKSVFLSYRFAEGEYVEGLCSLLEREGFSVVTGEGSNTYIGQAILTRIKAAEFFLCLMTKADEKVNGTYTTSPWLLEEKGAALGFGKKIVLMVENGVEDIGGLQGDWQRIHFSEKGFMKAAIRAVDQLKSYIDAQ